MPGDGLAASEDLFFGDMDGFDLEDNGSKGGDDDDDDSDADNDDNDSDADNDDANNDNDDRDNHSSGEDDNGSDDGWIMLGGGVNDDGRYWTMVLVRPRGWFRFVCLYHKTLRTPNALTPNPQR